MLRSNSKSLGNHVVSKEEREMLQWEGFAEKEGQLNLPHGDGKLIIISITVSDIGLDDHIRFYS